MIESNPIVRFLIGAAALVIFIAGMKVAQPIVVPLLLSIFLAVLLSPLLFWLTHRKVPTALAITGIIVGVFALFGILSSVVGGSVNGFIADLPFYQKRLNEISVEFSQLISGFLANFGVEADLTAYQSSFDPSQIMGLVGNTLNSVGNLMTNILLILVTVIFIMAEMQGWKSKLQFIERSGGGNQLSTSMSRIGETIVHYMTLKTWMSLATGILVSIALSLIGVDFAILWGLVAFLLNYIPNLGSYLAAVPAVLLAMVQLGVGDAVLTIIAYLVINMVIGNVVEPRVMGRGLNLSPLVVFLSLVLWGWILGPVGMFLSIPLTMVVKITLETIPETRSFAIMLGGAIPDEELEPMSDDELADTVSKSGNEQAPESSHDEDDATF